MGSKNAAFFIGSSVKMVTRRVGEPYVHELQLSAGELEQRYRLGQVLLMMPTGPLGMKPMCIPWRGASAGVFGDAGLFEHLAAAKSFAY